MAGVIDDGRIPALRAGRQQRRDRRIGCGLLRQLLMRSEGLF
jgi:hypothetical protein